MKVARVMRNQSHGVAGEMKRQSPRPCVHVLNEDGKPLCGVDLSAVDVESRFEVKKLPTIEGCGGCRRILEPRPQKRGEPLGQDRTVLYPSMGRQKVGQMARFRDIRR